MKIVAIVGHLNENLFHKIGLEPNCANKCHKSVSNTWLSLATVPKKLTKEKQSSLNDNLAFLFFSYAKPFKRSFLFKSESVLKHVLAVLLKNKNSIKS